MTQSSQFVQIEVCTFRIENKIPNIYPYSKSDDSETFVV